MPRASSKIAQQRSCVENSPRWIVLVVVLILVLDFARDFEDEDDDENEEDGLFGFFTHPLNVEPRTGGARMRPRLSNSLLAMPVRLR